MKKLKQTKNSKNSKTAKILISSSTEAFCSFGKITFMLKIRSYFVRLSTSELTKEMKTVL